MDPDNGGKDKSVAPADPKKSMIQRWCTSVDEVASPESVTSVIDIGSPPAFSPGMFSIKSPDLLLLKSPPSISSSWLKSPRSVPEISSEPPSVGPSHQDIPEDQPEGVDPEVVSDNNERQDEHGSVSAGSTDKNKEVITGLPDLESDVKLKELSRKYETSGPDDDGQCEESKPHVKCQENIDKRGETCKVKEPGNKNPSPSVLRETESSSSQLEGSYPPELFNASVSHHSVVLSGEESAKGHLVTSDALRRDSFPSVLHSGSDGQHQLPFIPGAQTFHDASSSQSHSLTDLSRWDPFQMPTISHSSTSTANPSFLVDKSAYDRQSTNDGYLMQSAKVDADGQLVEQSSGEQPAKSCRTLSYPGRSVSLSAGNLNSREGDSKDKSEFLSLVMRSQGVLGDCGLQFPSVTSSTHPPIQGSEKTFSKVRDESGSFDPLSALGHGSGLIGLLPFEDYKPFHSQTYQTPSERRAMMLHMADNNQKADVLTKSQEVSNPGRKPRTGGWIQVKLDGSTDVTQESTAVHSRRYQPYGLRRASSTEVRSSSDETSSSDQTQERTVGIVKDGLGSREVTGSAVKPDVSKEVALLDIHDSQSESRSHIDSTKADRQTCQVCGDLSASFHCGANVCEACKKFFVRCIRQEGGVKFVCHRKQNCEVTKETRTQCQYCRFQKCLSLGMYKPGGSNISSEIGHIPCKVCDAPSSGYHFGAITCEGCKGFFRRTIKERDHMKYRCGKGGNCVVTMTTRNMCKYCRYQKCLSVGMTPTGSRIGRQPNSVRHATLMQLQHIKTMKGLPTDPHLPQPTSAADVKQEPPADDVYGHQPTDSVDDEQIGDEVRMAVCHDLDDLCEDGVKKVGRTLASDSDGHSKKYWSSTEQQIMEGCSNDSHEELSTICDVSLQSCDIKPQRKQSLSDITPSSDGQGIGKVDLGPRLQQAHAPRQAHTHQPVSDELIQQSHPTHQSSFAATNRPGSSPRPSQPLPEHTEMPSDLSSSSSSNRNIYPPAVSPAGEQSTDINQSLFYSPVVDANILSHPDVIPLPREVMDASLTAPPAPSSAVITQPARVDCQSTDDIARDSQGINVRRDSTQSADPTSQSLGTHPQQPNPTETGTIPKSSSSKELNLVAATAEFLAKAPDQLKKIRLRYAPRIDENMSPPEMWNIMMSQFQECAHITLKFAKMVPGFRRIPIDRQIESIKQNMFPIVFIQLSLDYNVETSRYNYFTFEPEEEKAIMKKFPSFSNLIPPFHEMGQKVTNLNLSGIEVSFLCALILAFDAKDGLMVENLTTGLQKYIKENSQSQGSNKFGQILLILAEFKKLTEVHQKCVVEAAADPEKYPGIQIPQLFQETFINDP